MTKSNDEIERLIADVEIMTSSQRLLFVELFLRSLKEHELQYLLGRLKSTSGLAHALNNINLINHDRS
jgi:hypothetical protein